MTPPRSLNWTRGDPIHPGKYGHRRPQGPCSPGWDEIDIKRLADGAKVGYRNLLLVLTGQRNCTLGFLLHIARSLGIPPGELVARIEAAYDMVAAAHQSPLAAGGKMTNDELVERTEQTRL